MTMLVLEGVSKTYGGVAALDAVSLSLPDGGRTAIVGPSGSGKSTLFRLLVGFEAPDRGCIRLDGHVLADGPARVPAHRRAIGIVAQDGALFPHLSVADNIAFGLEPDRARHAGQVRDLMRLVELDPSLAGRYPHEVSGGQQQRVALARALARKPRLMLLDEPFSALDTGLREATRRSVARVLAEAGIPCVLVTHDQGEALSFADQLAVLHEGRVAQFGPPRELYTHPVDARVAAFLGDAILFPAEISGGSAHCVLGAVPVDPATGPGRATIMLRPEQIRLDAAGAGAAGCLARVVAVAFGGATSLVTLELPHAESLTGERNSFPPHAEVPAEGRPRSTHDGSASFEAPLRGAPQDEEGFGLRSRPQHADRGGRLELRVSGFGLPSVGDTVRLTVAGHAHVFAGEPTT